MKQLIEKVEDLIEEKRKTHEKIVDATLVYYNKQLSYIESGESATTAEKMTKGSTIYEEKKKLEGKLEIINKKIELYMMQIGMSGMQMQQGMMPEIDIKDDEELKGDA